MRTDRIDFRRSGLLAAVVALPFALGLAFDRPVDGVVASLAAFNLALVTLVTPAESRVRALGVALGILPLALAGGTLVGNYSSVELPLIALGIAACQLVHLDPALRGVALPATALFVIGVGLPPGPPTLALDHLALALIGSLILAVPVLIVTALERERTSPPLLPPSALDRGDRTPPSPSAPLYVHALIVGVAASSAFFIGGALGLPRDYWAMLTVVVVLQVELAATFRRASERMAGTVVGAAIGGALTSLTMNPWWLAASGLVFVGLTFGFKRANYSLYVVFLTAFVLVLLSPIALSGWPLAWARIEDTLLGGALALVVSALLFLWAGHVGPAPSKPASPA